MNMMTEARNFDGYTHERRRPQARPRSWTTPFKAIPWCPEFDKIVPQAPNEEEEVISYVLDADLPAHADEVFFIPGDHVRFAHFVLEEMSLADNPLHVLATQRYSCPEKSEWAKGKEAAENFSKDIVAFSLRKNSEIRFIFAATRVLIQDVVTEQIYSVSPKVLRKHH